MSRVLVVEDEAHLAQGLRFNLEAEGYSAEIVGDGEAATERLLDKKENFDAIVLDIMLPGMNGLELAQAIRSRWPAHIIAMSASARMLDRAEKEPCVDKAMAKPFDWDVLMEDLREAVA